MPTTLDTLSYEDLLCLNDALVVLAKDKRHPERVKVLIDTIEELLKAAKREV